MPQDQDRWITVYLMLGMGCNSAVTEAILRTYARPQRRFQGRTPLARLEHADPDLFHKTNYPRGVHKGRQPMVISQDLYNYLLRYGGIDPILRQELQNGVTYRGNHYFSPRHFCYDCELPFLASDHTHTTHHTFISTGENPFVGYYCGKFQEGVGLFPSCFKSVTAQQKFLTAINKQ